GEHMHRLLFYLASTVALWHLLCDRLDLLLALLVVLSLVLLLSRLHYAWSFAVLALAVNFKLVPLVLAPVWVIGSLPADREGTLFRPRVLLALATRVALLSGMVIAGFLPFYLLEGDRCLGFLTYHRARGLEIGSIWGSLLLALEALGQPAGVGHSY